MDSHSFGNSVERLRQSAPQFKLSHLNVETSSCGRLFDAVAAVSGVRLTANYEGQAAMELEALARCAPEFLRDNHVKDDDFDRSQFDTVSLVTVAARQRKLGVTQETIAWNFHAGLADMVAAKSRQLIEQHNLDTCCLSGGVFQNSLLVDLIKHHQDLADVTILLPEQLPCNDGGISFGQAVIAGQMELN